MHNDCHRTHRSVVETVTGAAHSIDIVPPAKHGFDADPVIQHREGCNAGVLYRDLSYVDKYGRVHTAHAGMPTDGGTIWRLPRSTWWLTGSPYGRYLSAFIIHDWYCIRANDLTGAERYQLRLEADILFREMLLYLGASKLAASIMFAGVRVGARF